MSNHTLISVREITPLPTHRPCGLGQAAPPGAVGGVWPPGTKPVSGIFLATGIDVEMAMRTTRRSDDTSVFLLGLTQEPMTLCGEGRGGGSTAPGAVFLAPGVHGAPIGRRRRRITATEPESKPLKPGSPPPRACQPRELKVFV